VEKGQQPFGSSYLNDNNILDLDNSVSATLATIACGPVAAFKHSPGNANLPIGASKPPRLLGALPSFPICTPHHFKSQKSPVCLIACGPVAAFKHFPGNANLPIGASKNATHARSVAVISYLYAPPLQISVPFLFWVELLRRELAFLAAEKSRRPEKPRLSDHAICARQGHCSGGMRSTPM
jgi:hypothetical protein